MNSPEPKKCVICGTEFIPKQKNYICCSSECSKERIKVYRKQRNENYYKGNKESIRERYRRSKIQKYRLTIR